MLVELFAAFSLLLIYFYATFKYKTQGGDSVEKVSA